MARQSINPDTGKLVKSFEHLTQAQLDTTATALAPVSLYRFRSARGRPRHVRR